MPTWLVAGLNIIKSKPMKDFKKGQRLRLIKENLYYYQKHSLFTALSDSYRIELGSTREQVQVKPDKVRFAGSALILDVNDLRPADEIFPGMVVYYVGDDLDVKDRKLVVDHTYFMVVNRAIAHTPLSSVFLTRYDVPVTDLMPADLYKELVVGARVEVKDFPNKSRIGKTGRITKVENEIITVVFYEPHFSFITCSKRDVKFLEGPVTEIHMGGRRVGKTAEFWAGIDSANGSMASFRTYENKINDERLCSKASCDDLEFTPKFKKGQKLRCISGYSTVVQPGKLYEAENDSYLSGNREIVDINLGQGVVPYSIYVEWMIDAKEILPGHQVRWLGESGDGMYHLEKFTVSKIDEEGFLQVRLRNGSFCRAHKQHFIPADLKDEEIRLERKKRKEAAEAPKRKENAAKFWREVEAERQKIFEEAKYREYMSQRRMSEPVIQVTTVTNTKTGGKTVFAGDRIIYSSMDETCLKPKSTAERLKEWRGLLDWYHTKVAQAEARDSGKRTFGVASPAETYDQWRDKMKANGKMTDNKQGERYERAKYPNYFEDLWNPENWGEGIKKRAEEAANGTADIKDGEKFLDALKHNNYYLKNYKLMTDYEKFNLIADFMKYLTFCGERIPFEGPPFKFKDLNTWAFLMPACKKWDDLKTEFPGYKDYSDAIDHYVTLYDLKYIADQLAYAIDQWNRWNKAENEKQKAKLDFEKREKAFHAATDALRAYGEFKEDCLWTEKLSNGKFVTLSVK